MNGLQTNNRGEFTDATGKLYHYAQRHELLKTTLTHEGAWLNCDGCNPVLVVAVSVNTGPADLLIQLRSEYGAAKAQEKEVKVRVATATSKLKAALFDMMDGALRASLQVPGHKPVTLTYSEPWQFDVKELQAEEPATYVKYAHKKENGQWTLAESRGKP